MTSFYYFHNLLLIFVVDVLQSLVNQAVQELDLKQSESDLQCELLCPVYTGFISAVFSGTFLL